MARQNENVMPAHYKVLKRKIVLVMAAAAIIPLIILARLAIDLDYQKRGLGFSLLQDAITRAIAVAEHAGIRALLTHPLDAEAAAFYRRFGFEPAPHDARQLLLLLKDARRVAGASK